MHEYTDEFKNELAAYLDRHGQGKPKHVLCKMLYEKFGLTFRRSIEVVYAWMTYKLGEKDEAKK